MMNKKRSILFILILMYFMTTCRNDDNQTSNDTANLPFQVAGELPVSGGVVVEGWITDAAIDLAQRLDVEVSDVTYIAFDVPVWSDASYGCPQPDQEYEAVIKEGYRIQLQVNGRDYFYHGGEDIEQFLCDTE